MRAGEAMSQWKEYQTGLKILNAVIVVFSLCIALIMGMCHMSLSLYFTLLLIEYLIILVSNATFREATRRFFIRKGSFGKKNHYYEAIHLETLVSDLEKMEPDAFKYFIRDVFRYEGYDAKMTPNNTKDLGADIIAKKGKEVIAIQVKHRNHEEWFVDNDAVQKVVASRAVYKANHSMVVTNGIFTENALAQALPNHTLMIDGKQLEHMVWDIICNHKQVENIEELEQLTEREEELLAKK